MHMESLPLVEPGVLPPRGRGVRLLQWLRLQREKGAPPQCQSSRPGLPAGACPLHLSQVMPLPASQRSPLPLSCPGLQTLGRTRAPCLRLRPPLLLALLPLVLPRLQKRA